MEREGVHAGEQRAGALKILGGEQAVKFLSLCALSEVTWALTKP
jgi:hypothetical protein